MVDYFSNQNYGLIPQKDQFPGGEGYGAAKKAYHDRARYEFLHSGAPQRLDDYRRFAQPLIQEKWGGAYLEQASTLAGQQRQSARTAGDQLATLGVDPAAFMARFQPEQSQNYASAMAGLRGASIAGQADEQLGLEGDILNALNQIEAYYDSLQLQNSLAAKSRGLERQGMRGAQTASMIGAGLGVAGSMLGTPAAGRAIFA
jgi:hypothetical protein